MSCFFSKQQGIFLFASLNRITEVVIRNTNRFLIVMNLVVFNIKLILDQDEIITSRTPVVEAESTSST